MRVLLNYLLHDMLAQFRRTLLVLFTLLLSSSAVLSSVALSDTMVRLGTNQWRAENGYSDILISATPASPSRFFNEFAADRFSGLFVYAVFRVSGAAELYGTAGPEPAWARGYNLEGLVKMTGLQFAAQRNLFPFEGNKVVVSRKTADEMAIGLGDLITVGIGGNRHALEVCAIAQAQGPFVQESDGPVLVLPYGKMQACLGELGRVDAIYGKLRDPLDKGRAIRMLADAYQGYRVGESYSEDHIRLQANRTAVPFVFMSVLLCFMAAYVLFTIFKGIVAGRLPLMGLFRAVGATKRDTWLVLAAESLFYGLVGGLLGCAAGMGMLWVMIRMLNATGDYQFITLTVGPPQLLLALGSAVCTSVIGAATCLMSEGNASICRQIKGVSQSAGESRRGLPWGLGLLFASAGVVLFWRSEEGLAVYIACVVGMLSGLVLLSPALYRHAASLLGVALRGLAGLARVAVLNVRGRRDFAVSATIISIIVATVLVISTISFSDRQGAELHYARIQYGVEVTMPGLDRQTLNLARQVRGVDGVFANYCSASVEVAGQAIPLYRVQGVTPEYKEFVDYSYTSTRDNPLAALEDGRNLLLTRTMQAIYGVEEGDSLTLKVFGRDGKYREVPYTVIGFFDDYHTKLGRLALISQANFAEDFAAREYDSLYVRSADPRAAATALEAAFANRQATIWLVQDDRLETERESAKIIGAMSFISCLAVVTGVLGILNIALLSFLRRRRETGLCYAIGMTGRDILAVTAGEQLLSGLLGSAAGTAMGLGIAALALPRLIFALQIAMRVTLDIRALWVGLPVGLLASLASSALCLLFIRRSNPMDGLRQEE